MDPYRNISNELKEAFSRHSVLGLLLPWYAILVLGGMAIMLANALIPFVGDSPLSDVLGAVAYWAFILGLLLAYASDAPKVIYVGLFLYGALNLYFFIVSIKYVWFSYLISAAVYGGLGYLVFRRSTRTASG